MGIMPELRVGEPTARYLASSTSAMMSDMWLHFRSHRRTGTPLSTNPSAMAWAMASVVCHMES